jgi:hypothetical protein
MLAIQLLHCTLRMCLDRAKNNIKIEELKIGNENSEKNSDFSISARIVKCDVILNGRNIVLIVC